MSDHTTSLTVLTREQAYRAMFEFLEAYWERGKSEEIAMLLGAMALQPDGHTADPAQWSDWLAACEKILRESVGKKPRSE